MKQIKYLWLQLKPNQSPATIVYKDILDTKSISDSGEPLSTKKVYTKHHEVYNLDQTIDPEWKLDTPVVEEHTDRPSAKQLHYLSSLIKRKYYEPWIRRDKMRQAYKFTRSEASSAIKELSSS